MEEGRRGRRKGEFERGGERRGGEEEREKGEGSRGGREEGVGGKKRKSGEGGIAGVMVGKGKREV